MRYSLLVVLCISSAAEAAPCDGPADPKLSAATVAPMLDGDDDYPLDEMKQLSPGVMPALVELASAANKDEYIRMRAISLIGDLGCPATAPVIEAALKDPDPTFRIPAADAIGKLHPDPTPLLVGMLADSDKGVVKFSIYGLGKFGDRRAIRPLDRLRRTHAHTWLRPLAKAAIADIRKRHP